MVTLRRALDETIKMRGFWDKYRTEFNYAKDIGFDDTCDSVLRIMNNISEG